MQSAAAVSHTDMDGETRQLYGSLYWLLCRKFIFLKLNTNDVAFDHKSIHINVSLDKQHAKCLLTKQNVGQLYAFHTCTLIDTVPRWVTCGVVFLTPAPEPGCVIVAAKG